MKKQMIDKKTKEIAEYYGYYSQSLIAIEEMAELTKELLKLRRLDSNKYVSLALIDKHINNKIAEETADVVIMLKQLIYLFKIEDKVEEFMEVKLDRQLKRIGELEDD